MEVLNERVNPPIKVVCKPTRSLNHWSENTFKDPVDDVPFFPEDLTPEELGHIYLHKVVADQWIQVFMPYKLMDALTGRLIQGLRSFRSCSPYLNGSLPEKHLRNPRSCLQHFKLKKADFVKFSNRVEHINGVLIEDVVDTDKLSEKIEELLTSKESIERQLLELRNKACRVGSEKYYNSEEDLFSTLESFKGIRELISAFNSDTVPVVIQVERLSKEVGRNTVKTKVSTEFKRLKDAQEELRKVPVDRFEREAIHKANVDLGKHDQSEIPIHIRSLLHEVNELKAYYPCLSRLRVINDSEIAIDLTGVDISITDKTVVVRGDPGALKAYMNDNQKVEEQSNRRIRNIMIPFPETVE